MKRLLLFCCFLGVLGSAFCFKKAEHDWNLLYKHWHINSAGYHTEEELEALYFKLEKYALKLHKNGHFDIHFGADSSLTGTFEINKKANTLLFEVQKTKRKFTYVISEISADHLLLVADPKEQWAYYLDLTSVHH